MKSIKSVLLVEDNAGDARLLREMFVAHESKLIHVTCMKDAEKHLTEHPVDMILLDLGLPDVEGVEAIRRMRAAAPRAPLVVLTGLDDELMAAMALQEGAQDYLIKGQIETRGLLRAMRYANERKRLEWMKDEFVSTVSHELRTPLTSIAASLGLLKATAAGILPESTVSLLAIAHTNSQRLVRLVNDILDIEKMWTGQVTFNFKRIAVRPLIDEIIDANREFAEASDVRIRLLEDARPCDDVRVNSNRLSQVVTNLLSNAIKFSPANAEVEVAIEKISTNVSISVRDHGPGISAEFKPRIFERFVQADATDSRLRGGIGLGLSIVKQIVDRLGGKVSFADAPGGGTVFRVDLPGWKNVAGVVAGLEARAEAVRR